MEIQHLLHELECSVDTPRSAAVLQDLVEAIETRAMSNLDPFSRDMFLEHRIRDVLTNFTRSGNPRALNLAIQFIDVLLPIPFTAAHHKFTRLYRGLVALLECGSEKQTQDAQRIFKNMLEMDKNHDNSEPPLKAFLLKELRDSSEQALVRVHRGSAQCCAAAPAATTRNSNSNSSTVPVAAAVTTPTTSSASVVIVHPPHVTSPHTNHPIMTSHSNLATMHRVGGIPPASSVTALPLSSSAHVAIPHAPAAASPSVAPTPTAASSSSSSAPYMAIMLIAAATAEVNSAYVVGQLRMLLIQLATALAGATADAMLYQAAYQCLLALFRHSSSLRHHEVVIENRRICDDALRYFSTHPLSENGALAPLRALRALFTARGLHCVDKQVVLQLCRVVTEQQRVTRSPQIRAAVCDLVPVLAPGDIHVAGRRFMYCAIIMEPVKNVRDEAKKSTELYNVAAFIDRVGHGVLDKTSSTNLVSIVQRYITRPATHEACWGVLAALCRSFALHERGHPNSNDSNTTTTTTTRSGHTNNNTTTNNSASRAHDSPGHHAQMRDTSHSNSSSCHPSSSIGESTPPTVTSPTAAVTTVSATHAESHTPSCLSSSSPTLPLAPAAAPPPTSPTTPATASSDTCPSRRLPGGAARVVNSTLPDLIHFLPSAASPARYSSSSAIQPHSGAMSSSIAHTARAHTTTSAAPAPEPATTLSSSSPSSAAASSVVTVGLPASAVELVRPYVDCLAHAVLTSRLVQHIRDIQHSVSALAPVLQRALDRLVDGALGNGNTHSNHNSNSNSGGGHASRAGSTSSRSAGGPGGWHTAHSSLTSASYSSHTSARRAVMGWSGSTMTTQTAAADADRRRRADRDRDRAGAGCEERGESRRGAGGGGGAERVAVAVAAAVAAAVTAASVKARR